MTAARLRVGIAGAGSMGRNHLRVLSRRADVTIAGVADPERSTVEAAASEHGANAYTDPLQLIDVGRLDALIIAAPTTSHLPIALAALERGVPILVEKPLAATTSEGAAIAREAARRGVPVQVGHIERFNPAVQKLARLVDGGWLTSVFALASRRAGPFPVRIRDVGVTIDLATHDADILSWIAGARPSRVYAETSRRIHAQHEDLLFGLLHFPDGATGMLDVNWLTPAKRRQLVVVGTEGMFELDYLTQRLTFTRAVSTDRPRLIRGFAPTFDGELAEIAVEPAEPLGLELDAFLGVVREGTAPLVDVEDGLWAVAIAEGLLRSAASNAAVQLTDVLATEHEEDAALSPVQTR